MTTIIGDVSLTNKTGVFLGEVNLSNLNANSNDLLYSPNGFDLSGLALSDGLSSNGSQISTVGNPAIQLTSNSLYVNDGVSSIQSGIDSASAAETIYVSSGSYGESVVINNKTNISIICPSVNTSTLCEILDGLVVSGTSTNIRVSNITIKGSSSSLSGTGSNVYNNMNFIGTVSQTHTLTIGTASTQFITIRDCGFNQYTTIVVPNTFADVLYFINCNFGGATITLNNVSPLQVIFNNCAGFTAYPNTATCTQVGMNVLADGSQFQCNTSRLFGIKSMVLQDGTDTLGSVNQALTTNGVTGLKLVNLPDNALRLVDTYSGQYAGSVTGNPITIYQKANQLNVIPQIPSLMMFSFNLQVAGGNDVLTLTLQNDNDSSVITSLQFNVESVRQTIAGQFNFTMPNVTVFNYSIVGSLTTHNITINPTGCFGITIYQNNN